MLRTIASAAAFLAAVVLSAAARADYEYEPTDEAASRIDLAEAKRLVTAFFVGRSANGISWYESNIDSVKFTPDYFELVRREASSNPGNPLTLVAMPGKYQYAGMAKPKLYYTSRALNDDYLNMSLPRPQMTGRGGSWMSTSANRHIGLFRYVTAAYPWSGDKARRYADALHRLLLEHQRLQGPSTSARFEDALKSYLAANPKPELPEDARRFKIQAEAAVRGKRFDEAYERFMEALDIAPWWPEGRFNVALVLGELQSYRSAIREMNRYLQLLPSAPDARAVKDKIYEWEGQLAERR